ncbi:hypothetical protein, partial [Escherichia coli]|uniref:hypothetical protein n=1 Tax=Escherichia coli TaxID=562 RepID=UPI003F80E177
DMQDNVHLQGEYHLTNAIQKMIEQGIVFDAFKVNNWFDCGKKDTLLSTNALLLKQQYEQQPASAIINQDTTVIIQPVSIAEG